MIGERIRDKKISPIPSKLSALAPTETVTAPTIPPINAWEEELGIPHHQVAKFQIIAPIKAAEITP